MKLFFGKKNKSKVDEANHDKIDGERTITSVNKGLGLQTKITNVVIFICVAGLGCFLLFKYYSNFAAEKKAAKAAAQRDVKVTKSTNLPPLAQPTFSDPFTSNNQGSEAPPPLQQGPNQQSGASGKQAVLSPEELDRERRLGSPLFFKVEGSSSSNSSFGGNNDDTGSSNPSKPTNSSPQIDDENNPLAKSLQGTRLNRAKAYMLDAPSYTITMGQGIPCTVIPALDTTLPGIVTCIQSADVFSTDHKVLLLEAGTKWIGEQKTGLSQGQRRVAILWTRGETPNHVLINVDSAAGDSLGRTGIDGEINNHFVDRFGAAIMLSLISDVGSYLAATQQSGGSNNNNTTIAFPNTIQGTQNVMSDVLKQTLNIPPTLTKNQGAQITIYVARDLDFRDVYDLKVKQ